MQVRERDNRGQRIDAAMEAIEKENPSLKGVLPKAYAREDIDKRLAGSGSKEADADGTVGT